MEKIKGKRLDRRMPYRQEIYNIAITITHLEKMIEQNKENPIDNFLQKEVVRLREKKERLIKNVKNN